MAEAKVDCCIPLRHARTNFVYTTILDDYVGRVRVKSAELKTRLSHYLHLVHETGEEIEVCIREKPVAYLTRTKDHPMNAADDPGIRELEAAFRTAGITLVGPVSPPTAENRLPVPRVAGDGRSDLSTAEETRRQRDW